MVYLVTIASTNMIRAHKYASQQTMLILIAENHTMAPIIEVVKLKSNTIYQPITKEMTI